METYAISDIPTTQADVLRADLSALLEAITRLDEHDRPVLMAHYLAALGGLEYRLMTLQVESLALQRRIEMIQQRLNRGARVSVADVVQIEHEIAGELQGWQTTLQEKEAALSGASELLSGLIAVSADQVQRVKSAYRRLARLLHPDVSPLNAALFERYWNAVQQAYLAMDEALLEAILHLVEHEAEMPGKNDTMEELARLQDLIARQAQRLAQLQSSSPFCYAHLLNNEVWVASKRSQLEEAIQLEAARQARLIARYAAIKAQIVGG